MESWLFLRSVGLLLLSVGETGLEAQQGRQHVLQLKSQSTMAEVVVYTGRKDAQFCFFPRKAELPLCASLCVVSLSEN